MPREGPSLEQISGNDELDSQQIIASIGELDESTQYWIGEAQNSFDSSKQTISSDKGPVNWRKWLPDYASPLSPSITSQDCNVLKEEGALSVSEPIIRDEILHNFIQFVYPASPILNLEDFLMVIDQSYSGTRGISFLLFQAVMFAATGFQTTKSLAIEGFKDRKEARRTRFKRVNLLYEFGCEDDRLTTLQSVLLMTYWDENSDPTYDAWHFVGVAKAIWTSIKTNPTESEKLFIQQQPGLWNRISWSCYIRDRLVCIQTRRLFQINDIELIDHVLGPSDFEIGPLSTKCCLGSDGNHPAIRDPSMRKIISQISIAILECCKCITRIINSQYTVSLEQTTSTGRPKETLVPRSPGANSAEILFRDSELEEWVETLPDALKWCSSEPQRRINKHGDVVLHFRAMLNDIYNLACSALHRPQFTSMAPQLPELEELSRRRVSNAAAAITQTCSYFRSQALIRLFSDVQVAMLETAIVQYLSDLQSTDSSARQLAITNFQTCSQTLQQLKDTYPSADRALAFVDAAVQKRDTPLPREDLYYSHSKSWEGLQRQNTATSRFEARIPVSVSSQNIGQQLDNLELPELNKLIYSHFMMTPSEKRFLQDLAPTESSVSDGSSVFDEDPHDSASPESPASYQSPTSHIQYQKSGERATETTTSHHSVGTYEFLDLGEELSFFNSVPFSSTFNSGCS
ncbi:uncharacterized protein N7511_007750 [Penicillium nucicola]|uniref:uncharacterized protein n=1 Tax=Penicillium nucicola TaxID=1850975 RepID=UPI00254566DB|nr:uncharacterized protein N7511_007750 [Penicillium nucicola]KAJ5753597.1 hypothetical protein N7511_007750 [Penicillium nucicola]